MTIVLLVILILIIASVLEINFNENYQNYDGCLSIVLGLRFRKPFLGAFYLLLIIAAFIAIVWMFISWLLSVGWWLLPAVLVALICGFLAEIIALVLIRLIIYAILIIK